MANPTWFLLVQSIQASVAIVGGAVAAYFGIRSARDSVLTRREEQKWKKANLARQMMKEMESDPDTQLVYDAIDYDQITIDISGNKTTINNKFLDEAISGKKFPLSEEEIEIRAKFDKLFVQLERFEHAIKRELIEFEDIKHYFHYYVRQMSHNKYVREYLSAFHFSLALDFLNRFS